jgi:DNA/RNA endonuclease YhcR with UshA esterase domain
VVDFYRGLTEIKNPTIVLAVSGRNSDPLPIGIAQMGDTANRRERHEGRLVVCRGLFDTTGVFRGNRNYPFRDASGRGTVYIDSSVSDILGKPIPTDTVNLTGCVSQYDASSPYFSGYQLMPRFFADIAGSQPATIMTIADALIDADSNTVPDLLDSVVTVTGIVTVPAGVQSRTRTDIFIQDRTAGVNVYDPSAYRNLKLGDSLVVTGTVTVYRGKLELTSPQVFRADSNHPVPEPAYVSCREIAASRRLLGSLVAVRGASANALIVQSGSNTLLDTSGAANLYVSSSSEVPGFVLVQDTFTVIGVKSQYGSSGPPYNSGYEIIPRFRSDFSRGLENELALRTIAEVQEPGTGGYSSRFEGEYVKVRGRVTGPNSIFTSGSAPSFYIQDGTNGINVYAPTTDSTTGLYLDSLGTELEVIGKVTEYSGLTELADGVARISDTNRLPVAAAALPFNGFLTEGLESRLVAVTGDVITPPAAAGGGTNFTIKNGNSGLTVRIVTGAAVPLAGVRPGKRVRCTGIVGQYSSTPPYGDGYQLMLRFPEDLIDSTAGLVLDSAMRIAAVDPAVFNPGAGQTCAIGIASPGDRKLYLQVFDLEGRMVRELLTNVPGHAYQVLWDGTNDREERLPIGTYILNLKGVKDSGGIEIRRRLVVLGTRLR